MTKFLLTVDYNGGGPELAKVVTSDGVTAPVVTDGRFVEFKEMLAGYQLENASAASSYA